MIYKKIPVWLPPVLIAAAGLISGVGFLLFSEGGIPMADSYIHFAYARNLALAGEYNYNLGAVEGIGSTSLLWVLVLAGFLRIGIPLEITSLGLGLALLAASGMLVYGLAWKIFQEKPPEKRMPYAVAAGLLTVIPGSMLWLALSGMEAILFFFLSLLALYLYDQSRWCWMGLVLGLLALTRTEGLILAGSIGLVDVIRRRRISKELLIAGLVTLVIVAPWIVYLQVREGILATASYQGRMVMVAETNARISDQPVLDWLISINPVVYIVCWAAFLFLYASGAAGLPGPIWEAEGSLLGTQLRFPYSGWSVVFLLFLPLLLYGIYYLWQERGIFWDKKPGQRLLAVGLLWIGLHNLAYAVHISQIGAAGRYAPMNHVLFWIFLVLGGSAFKRKRIRSMIYIVIGFFLIVSQIYWFQVYQANIRYNEEVKIAAARYIAQELRPEVAIGATDLGPIRYYASQPVVDLIGHVNQEIGPFREGGGTNADYLRYKELCYLMLYNSSGKEGIDFAQELGYNVDERFTLISEARFEIDLDTWRLGSEPLRNYLPAVEVYRIDWHDLAFCDTSSELD